MTFEDIEIEDAQDLITALECGARAPDLLAQYGMEITPLFARALHILLSDLHESIFKSDKDESYAPIIVPVMKRLTQLEILVKHGQHGQKASK